MIRPFSFLGIVLGLLASPHPLHAEPLRLSTQAFGVTAEVEVRDLPRAEAEAAIHAALAEIYTISRLVDPAGGDLPGSVAQLNATVEIFSVDPRISGLLLGSLGYCLWSNGAHGPLAGSVYGLWKGIGADKMPHPIDLREALETADCNRLTVRGTPSPAASGAAQGSREGQALEFQIQEGSQVLVLGSAPGFAADQAIEVLRGHGATNALVEIGNVVHGIGPGPDGAGWLLSLPSPKGESEPLDEVWLRDMSAAVVVDRPIYGAVPLLDQRTGVPARGVVLVAAVSENAFDAQTLATTLFVTGMRDGLRRLGALDPRPSVYWLLGDGESEQPLSSTYRWSDLPRLKRSR